MPTMYKGLFPFLEGAFGKSRKALPQGMSENPEQDGGMAPVTKAPSRWRNAITGGGAAEDAYNENYRALEKSQAQQFQKGLLDYREAGDNERLARAHEQQVSLEDMRAKRDMDKMKAESEEKMRPYFTASLYPNGVPETADARTKMLYNYGRFGPDILQKYGQGLADSYMSQQKEELINKGLTSEAERQFIGEAAGLRHSALRESVRGSALKNDEQNILNSMDKPLPEGYGKNPVTGAVTLRELSKVRNVPTVVDLPTEISMGVDNTGKPLPPLKLNRQEIRNEGVATPASQKVIPPADPNQIDPVELAAEENKRLGEKRQSLMKAAPKAPTPDGTPEKKKDNGVADLVKKFLKLL